MPASANVLTNPELLRSVCFFFEPSDRLELLRVSRLFFNAAAHFVWENIEGVEILLLLIPGVRCFPIDAGSKMREIIIPEDDLDFQRFDLYAPFVKNLEIFSKKAEGYSIPGWWRIGAHAKRKTLLPNLGHLTLETPSIPNSQLMWIRMFLSPALVEITVVPPPTQTPLISYSEASTLLKYIAAVCPTLEYLSLFPDFEDTSAYSQGLQDSSVVARFWENSMAQHLAQMRSLYELHTTTQLLAPEILAGLAALPCLEYLSIYPTTHTFQASASLHKNSFRSLQTFGLCAAPHSLFEEVWRLQCFKRLTTLKLTFITLPESKEDRVLWLGSMMSLIRDNSPKLAELTIDFDRDHPLGPHIGMGDSSILDPMKDLPLETLELFKACICPIGHYEVNIYSLVPAAWSQITVLNLPDEEGTSSKLYWFSKLPKLEYLTLRLQLATPLPVIPPISRQTNFCFDTLVSSGPVGVTGDTNQIARWLVSLWPTIKGVDWSSETEGENGVTNSSQSEVGLRYTASDAVVSGLNGMITLLRELSETKLRLSREIYGSQALELFSQGL